MPRSKPPPKLSDRKARNYDRARRLLAEWENRLEQALGMLQYALNKRRQLRAAVARYEKQLHQ
jgi:hypothetical protein